MTACILPCDRILQRSAPRHPVVGIETTRPASMRAYLNPIVGILILLASAIPVSHARDYDVEVIVFERHDPDDKAEASYSLTPRQLAAHRSRLSELSSTNDEVVLQSELSNLSRIASNLEHSGFTLISTARWLQPPSFYQHAPVVSLGNESSALPHAFIRIYKTSLIFADLYLELLPGQPDPGLTPSVQDAATETPQTALPSITVNGTTIEPLPDPSYILSEKRRLKFGEIHYFDHPRFGVILGVWPNPA